METILGSILGAFIGGGFALWITQFQIKELKRQIEIMIKQSSLLSRELASKESEINEIFVNHPHLFAYFYKNKEVPTDSELKDQLMALARRMMDDFAILLLNQKEFPEIFGEWVNNTIRNRYSTSPILQETLRKYINEYEHTGKIQFGLMEEGIRKKLELKSLTNKRKLESMTK